MSQTKVTDNLRDTTQLDGAKITTGTIPEARITSLDATKLTGTVADARISTLTASKLSGALPAISGASLTGLPAGGDKRNFIIDGDFTQWPEGTTQTSLASGQYGPAMWRWWGANAQSRSDLKRSTDVPTVAQSGHQSAYSFQMDCTTAEDAVAASEWAHVDYHVTGNDFAHLHQQEVTLNFWHKHTKTGTFCVAFRNSAQNRSYVAEYTQTTTNTWEEATITLTLDTGGTWLFTEADIGLTIFFTLYTGSTFNAAANTWHAGDYGGTSNQVNGLDSTSNNFMLSQVSLTLGSSAPTFTSLPISTVQDQVQYYVEAFNYDQEGSVIHLGTGCFVSTTQLRTHTPFATRKRVAPTMTSSTSMSPAHFAIQYGTSGSDVNSIIALMHVSTVSFVFAVTHVPTVSMGEAGQLRVKAVSGAFVLADARH